MSNLLLHCNAVRASYDDLKKVILPEDHPKFKDKGGRYGTVPHHRLVDAVRVMSGHMFGQGAIVDEQFGLSESTIYPGARFFALFKFNLDGSGIEEQIQQIEELIEKEVTEDDEIMQNLSEEEELEAAAEATLEMAQQQQQRRIIAPDDRIYPAFAIRNSHDRSMGISAALGHNCFICDNLALSGDVMFARKHTLNAMHDVLMTFWSLIKTMREQYEFDQKFRDRSRETAITTDKGYEILGKMAGTGSLSFEGGNKSQFAMALHEWKDPRFDIFEERTLWSLYNAVTYAQRKTGIGRRLEAGSNASAIMREILDTIEGGGFWAKAANEITAKYKTPSRSTMLELLDIITALPQTE